MYTAAAGLGALASLSWQVQGPLQFFRATKDFATPVGTPDGRLKNFFAAEIDCA
jgi:hypothetical protein